MRKIIILLLIITTSIVFTGCDKIIRGRSEIVKYVFIKSVGFDKFDDNMVRMIIPVIDDVSGGADAPKDEKTNIIKQNGKTLFEANRKAHMISNKDLLWAHLQFIIIGEEAAKSNLIKYLDFVSRDHEVRLNSNVVIAKDSTAEKLIDEINISKFEISERLQSITDNAGAISYSGGVKLSELIQMLDNPYACAYVPYVQLVKRIKRFKDDEDSMDAKLEGYAIVKNGKVIGYISDGTSRGLNIVNNKFESSVTVVKDKKGNDITLEILRASSKIEPKLSNGKIEVTIKVEEECNIAEYEGSDDIFNEKSLQDIIKQQNNIIKSDIKAAIKYAQDNKADFLGIGDAVYRKYPVEWENYKEKWINNIFPKVKINVEVQTRLARVYIIKEPTGMKEKKK